MGSYHIGDGECRFKVVCSSPDVCEVGGDKVPFDSYQTLDSERQYSSTVWARGCRALNVGSVIAGTQSNAGKGVISGTSQGTGDCVILTGSPTVTIEGRPVAYHGSVVGVNNHNCLGKLYTKIKSPIISVVDRTFSYERTAEVIHDLLFLKDLLSVGNVFGGDISPEIKNDLFQIKDPDQSWGEFFSIKNIRESLRNSVEGDKSKIREWFGENTLTQMGNGAITTLHGVADLALVTFDALLDTATATVACPIGEDGLCEQANINLNEKEQALFDISDSLINGQAWDALKKIIMDANNGDQVALENISGFIWGFMIPTKKIPMQRLSPKLEKYDLSSSVFIEPKTNGIQNKFPNEIIPTDGKIILFSIENGNIKGLNGLRVVDFVIDMDGKLIIGKRHHLLGNRGPVLAAGALFLNGKGNIRRINNLSGHYRPTPEEVRKIPELLQNAGVNAKGAQMEIYGMIVTDEGFVERVVKVSSEVVK